MKEQVVGRGLAVFPDGVYYLHAVAPGICEIRFHEFLSGRVRVISKIEALVDLASGLAVSADRQTFL